MNKRQAKAILNAIMGRQRGRPEYGYLNAPNNHPRLRRHEERCTYEVRLAVKIPTKLGRRIWEGWGADPNDFVRWWNSRYTQNDAPLPAWRPQYYKGAHQKRSRARDRVFWRELRRADRARATAPDAPPVALPP